MASRKNDSAQVGRWEPPATRTERTEPDRGAAKPAREPVPLERVEETDGGGGWFGPLLVSVLLIVLFNVGLALRAPDLADLPRAATLAPGAALFGTVAVVLLTGSRALAWIGALALTALALLVAADIAYAELYGRSFDLMADGPTLPRGVRVLAGEYGVEPWMALAGLALGALAVFALALWMLGSVVRLRAGIGVPAAMVLLIALAGLGSFLSTQAGGPPWQARAAQTALAQGAAVAGEVEAEPMVEEIVR